ncbi:MAG: hypothetical protein JO099_01885 [Acidobacteriia bacterium]|nr:hypothetical protein [Terriglobia bacterium]
MGILLTVTPDIMVSDLKDADSEASVPERLRRAHLERVLRSATFARAEQLRRLLGWLGNRSLVPDVAPPTEKEIAQTVLRRKDFDPQTDSLVRKEMRRLREKLQEYYAQEGARERVRLLSAGGYLLRFVCSDREISPAADSALPCVLVLPFRSHADLRGQAISLFEELLVLLGEQGSAPLIAPTTALSYSDRVGDIREFAGQCGADVVVEGSLALEQTQIRLTLWFVDGATGRVDRHARFQAAEENELCRLAGSWLHEQILRRR